MTYLHKPTAFFAKHQDKMIGHWVLSWSYMAQASWRDEGFIRCFRYSLQVCSKDFPGYKS